MDDPTNLTLEKVQAIASLLAHTVDPTLPVAVRLSWWAHELMRRRFAPEQPSVGLGFGGTFVGVRLYVDRSLEGTHGVRMNAEQEREWLRREEARIV